MLIPYVSTLSPLSLTKPVTDGFGVNIHFTHAKAGEIEMIAAAGFKWVRLDLFWGETEHRHGEYNFGDYENLMSSLEKHNMSALFVLDYGNELYEKTNAVTNEKTRAAYAQWASAAVDHFKGRGIIWEIWNEPNGNTFWNKHSDVNEYSAMALEAVKAIRAKTPNEIIIGPATATVDLGFIDDCLKAGLSNYWDAISIHPYRDSAPETTLTDYNKLKSIISRHAPKGKTIPIISGEWGYSSAWNHFDPIIQGKYLARELLSNVMNNISISIWYDWHDDGSDIKNAEHNFGIVQNEYHSGNNPVYTPKEAYLSAKTITSVLKGYSYVKRIATNDADDYIMLFSNGHDLRIAVWTSSPHSHKITIPSDKCDFEIINWKGDKHETTSSKDGHLTLIVNDFPQYIIVKGPNHALETTPEANRFNAIIIPVHGKQLSVRIDNLHETPVNGTVRLTDIKGIEPSEMELHFQISNRYERVFNFSLKSEPINDYTVGIRIESNGNVENFPAQRFHSLPNHVLTDCSINPDGDPKIKSEQSVSVHSAPEPLRDSDSTVLKIDYHLYGNGWKYLSVHVNQKDNRKIPDEPKAIGLWVYGDGHGITPKMRIEDASYQIFQLHPHSRLTIDWHGWKCVFFNINDYEGPWGGSKDGKMHYPLEIETLLLMDNQHNFNGNGTIYIAAPVIIY